MTAIPAPRALPMSQDRPAQGPRTHSDEDPSGPIVVGTTWQAPARLASTNMPAVRSIQSDARPTAGGVIQPGRGTSDRSVRGNRPPTGETEVVHEFDATVTHGFRPLRPEEGPNLQGVSLGTAPTGGTEVYPVMAPVHRAPPQVAPSDSALEAAVGSPTLVGRYEVLLRIARGGMGTVYLCRVTGEGGFRRLFALKVIRDHLSRNKEYVDMLLQEARIASRLHHPNVVGIVDIGMLSGQHYLVMDYVEGCTFSELLKVHAKNRPPQLIVPIILDALTGLHAAHTLTEDDGSPLTLVHCDFSPHNMLVGTNGICMISDFGIAKAADALHERGVTRGKPAFLSPEQVTGQRIDHRSDIFSAGVVLWNALTGEQLFRGETIEETMDHVLRAEIPPPSQVGLRPPRCFDAVCLKALQRDPAQRYRSAQEMLIELRRVAITEDLLAPSTDIARWVTQTFGHQLERRRVAAGIVKPSRPSKPDLPIMDLGLPTAGESATHAIVQIGADSPHTDETQNSRTMMLGQSAQRPVAKPADSEKLKTYLIASAAAMAAALAVSAAMRPQWFSGGYVDEHGTYVDMPATFEVRPRNIEDPPVVLPPSTTQPKPPGVQTPSDAKVPPDAPVKGTDTPQTAAESGTDGGAAPSEPASTGDEPPDAPIPSTATSSKPKPPTPAARPPRRGTPTKPGPEAAPSVSADEPPVDVTPMRPPLPDLWTEEERPPAAVPPSASPPSASPPSAPPAAPEAPPASDAKGEDAATPGGEG